MMTKKIKTKLLSLKIQIEIAIYSFFASFVFLIPKTLKIQVRLFIVLTVIFFSSPIFLKGKEMVNLESQEITILKENFPAQLKTVTKKLPFLETGENLRFKIMFIGLTAGYASINMRPASEENPNLFFQLTAESAKWVSRIYTLKMNMFSFARPETFATVKYIEEKRERKNYYYATQYFSKNDSNSNFSMHYTWRKNDHYDVKYFSDAIPGVSVPAAFFFARSMPLEVGETYYTMCAFRDRAVPIGVEVVERKKIKTSYGKKDTIVIRPIMRFDGLISDQKDMLIYLSDDERKVPLLMEAITKFGNFKAVLIEGY